MSMKGTVFGLSLVALTTIGLAWPDKSGRAEPVQPPSAEHPVQAIDEEDAIGESCERIDNLAVGDVRLRARQTNRASVVVANREATRQHPAKSPGLVSNPVLDFEVVRTPIEVFIQVVMQAQQIFRMHASEPLIGTRTDLLL